MPGKKCLADLYNMTTVSAQNIGYVAVLVRHLLIFFAYLIYMISSAIMSLIARSLGHLKMEHSTQRSFTKI